MAICPSLFAGPPTPGSCDALLGVWEYKEPARGRAIITKLGDKYTMVYFQLTGRQMGPAGPATGAPTEAEKAAAYDALSGGASEYGCEGSGGKLRWKGRTLYSAKPETGPAWTLDMELAGDDARWWFLGSDGTRGPMGEARRVK